MSPDVFSLTSDLEEMLSASEPLWESFTDARVFMTGGTGFIGRWLLESFLYANRVKSLRAKMTVLSRDPESFKARARHLAQDPAVRLIYGDVRNFIYPEPHFTHIVHAATDSSSTAPGPKSRLHMVDTIVSGTRRVLEFARKCGAPRMLYLSSAAIYGREKTRSLPIAEDEPSGPLLSGSTIEYDESKRMAEALCVLYHREFGLPITIARGFSFVGPYLPMRAHFALGNFIGAVADKKPIEVKSDGSAVRSYLYASDLARWLFTLLSQGRAGLTYNVGSDKAVSIGELARLVAGVLRPETEIRILGNAVAATPASYQVPDITRAAEELNLKPLVSLEDAIKRTGAWYAKAQSSSVLLTPPVRREIISDPDAVVFDFDGVMTDNRVIVFQDEREGVACDRADGLGVAMLRERGIPMLVLSTEANPVVKARCNKLKLECLHGIEKKEDTLAAWLDAHGYAAAKTIYVGNDINDLGCLRLVGYPVAVGDANDEVKAIARLVLNRHGGKGAVRELVDRIISNGHAAEYDHE